MSLVVLPTQTISPAIYETILPVVNNSQTVINGANNALPNYTPILLIGGLILFAVVIAVIALRNILKVKWWNFRRIPYYYWRIIDNNFQVIYSQLEKDIGQKAFICQDRDFAGIIPTDRPVLLDGSCKELVYTFNDARPITYVDINDYPEIKKLAKKEKRFIFFTRMVKPVRYEKKIVAGIEKDVPVYEVDGVIGTLGYIQKDIPTRWLKKTLESQFIPMIQETPPEKFGWLREVAMLAIIGVIVLGGLFMVAKMMGMV
jgi:hypothetical protein